MNGAETMPAMDARASDTPCDAMPYHVMPAMDARASDRSFASAA